MASVKSLCNRALVLENGYSVFDGSTEKAIFYYFQGENESGNQKTFGADFDKEVLQYRDLLMFFVKRAIFSGYQQTGLVFIRTELIDFKKFK